MTAVGKQSDGNGDAAAAKSADSGGMGGGVVSNGIPIDITPSHESDVVFVKNASKVKSLKQQFLCPQQQQGSTPSPSSSGLTLTSPSSQQVQLSRRQSEIEIEEIQKSRGNVKTLIAQMSSQDESVRILTPPPPSPLDEDLAKIRNSRVIFNTITQFTQATAMEASAGSAGGASGSESRHSRSYRPPSVRRKVVSPFLYQNKEEEEGEEATNEESSSPGGLVSSSLSRHDGSGGGVEGMGVEEEGEESESILFESAGVKVLASERLDLLAPALGRREMEEEEEEMGKWSGEAEERTLGLFKLDATELNTLMWAKNEAGEEGVSSGGKSATPPRYQWPEEENGEREEKRRYPTPPRPHRLGEEWYTTPPRRHQLEEERDEERQRYTAPPRRHRGNREERRRYPTPPHLSPGGAVGFPRHSERGEHETEVTELSNGAPQLPLILDQDKNGEDDHLVSIILPYRPKSSKKSSDSSSRKERGAPKKKLSKPLSLNDVFLSFESFTAEPSSERSGWSTTGRDHASSSTHVELDVRTNENGLLFPPHLSSEHPLTESHQHYDHLPKRSEYDHLPPLGTPPDYGTGYLRYRSSSDVASHRLRPLTKAKHGKEFTSSEVG